MSDEYYIVVEGTGENGTIAGHRTAIGFKNEDVFVRAHNRLLDRGYTILGTDLVSFERAIEVVGKMPYESLVTGTILGSVGVDEPVNAHLVATGLGAIADYTSSDLDDRGRKIAISHRLVNELLPEEQAREVIDAMLDLSK